jgi:hypothetical protein
LASRSKVFLTFMSLSWPCVISDFAFSIRSDAFHFHQVPQNPRATPTVFVNLEQCWLVSESHCIILFWKSLGNSWQQSPLQYATADLLRTYQGNMMDPIHRHCGDLCSTQDQHRIHTGSTQREHVKHKTKLRSILSIGSSLADTLSFVKVVSLSNSGSSTAYPFWRTAWQTLQVYTGLLRACTNQIWPSTKNPLATPATLSTLFSLALHVYLQDLSSPTSRPWRQWIQPNWTLADSTCYKLLLRLPQRPASPTIWLFYPMLHSVLCLSKPGLRWGHVGMEPSTFFIFWKHLLSLRWTKSLLRQRTTARSCARASVHVWFLCLCDANPIFAFGAPERYTRYSISVAS